MPMRGSRHRRVTRAAFDVFGGLGVLRIQEESLGPAGLHELAQEDDLGLEREQPGDADLLLLPELEADGFRVEPK